MINKKHDPDITYGYFEDNDEEEECSIIERSPDSSFEVYGTTRTVNKKDFYVTVFINGSKYSKNPDLKISRISILRPEYLNDVFLTRDQVEMFDRIMHINWLKIKAYLCDNYTHMPGDKNEPFMLFPMNTCPDYSKLETSE